MISFKEQLVGVVLLAGFSVCSWAAHDPGYAARQRVDVLLQEIPLRREVLLEEVLRISSDLTWSYDALEAAKENSENAVLELQTLWDTPLFSPYPGLSEDLRKYQEELQAEFRLIERFKTQESVLRNSLAYLPVAYRDALEKVRPQDRQALEQVLQETLLYRQKPDEAARYQIEAGIQRLDRQKAGPVHLLMMHLRQVLRLEPLQRAELSRLNSVTRSEPLQQLASQYQLICNTQATRRSGMVALQYLLSLIVLIFLAETVRKLNQAFSEVHTLNQELEARVRERTRRLEESHRREESIQQELSRAHRLEAIGHLAAGIAHEINTPIQFVGDNTRFLRDSFAEIQDIVSTLGDLDNDDYSYLKKEIPLAISQSLEGLGRVSEIVLSLKAFSHPGGQDRAEVDLNEIVRATVTVARGEWKYVAEVEQELDEYLPHTPCQATELSQALLNLIVNAAHAIQAKVAAEPDHKGRIVVRTRCQDGFAEILVSDSGVGMDRATLERIYVPFFTTKEVGRGTGQGLSIAYDIVVNKHGGKLTCQSEPGQGTCFTLSLPLAPARLL